MCASRLVDRDPRIEPEQLIAEMVPPPAFQTVRLANYRPDPGQPSQSAALAGCAEFVREINTTNRPGDRSWLSSLLRRRSTARGEYPGLYLDGGFGVGKTHLLASIWHEVEGRKAFGSFVELTNLLGALGFREAVRRLADHRLLAIDEFELDDPGDTTLVSGLLAELTAAGVFIAATSNTLPERLGEGRFAAEDFLREIQAMAASFRVLRVAGPDYRHRGMPRAPEPSTDAELDALAASLPGATLDEFDELCVQLSAVHPSRYGRLVEPVGAVLLRGVHPVARQDVALRLVALIDRLYDRGIPLAAGGVALSELFDAEILSGGYRKKYLRALSRLLALASYTGALGAAGGVSASS
ncbi:MAG: cell division protein ZapE [Sciscionella sp.]